MPVYKYGRLPGKIPVGLRTLDYYRAGSLPPPPAKVSVPAVPPNADGTSWGMDGNNVYGDCVVPETRILTRDLRWIPAGELNLGDHLLSFEEEPPDGKRRYRQYRTAVVENNLRVTRPCYDLEFDDGTRVRCSSGHKWLAGSPAAHWLATEQLRPGQSRIIKPLKPWTADSSYESGYLAAAFDGEGNLSQYPSGREGHYFENRVAFAQVDNPMLAFTEQSLKYLGYDFTRSLDARSQRYENRQDVWRLAIAKRSEFLRFLGSTRPRRLLDKLEPDRLGRLDCARKVRLVSKKFAGDCEVVMLDTSTRTYLAEGLASHNCGVAGINHGFMAAASIVQAYSGETWPTDQQVVDYYLSYTGGADTGVVLADFLAYVKSHQFFGHTIQGYAPITVSDIPTLQFAVDAYAFSYTGIYVTNAMEAAFQNGQPWTLEDLFSPQAGGHCIPLVGYDSNYLYCVTWGKVQAITYSAWHFIADEAWAVIPGEFTSTDGRGISLSALQQDLSKLA